MDVRYSSNVPKEKLIVEKLMQGPTGNGAYPTINPDTNLLSVTIKDHVCYVNFDSTFLTSVYDVLPEITIYSLVDSIIAEQKPRRYRSRSMERQRLSIWKRSIFRSLWKKIWTGSQ